ncbi:hypothetical protein ANCDUO_15906 [Ancylostoma duodenale]|uniref:Uncharacterized protein n=1 Tax=Ancylostoma duodenale TaxID=51022 RepID=A0A0C2G4Y0_9BILA|nr:hypothetical protein ANCDUO_27557 [Ancylostoma duodenale]KIH53949.1 hypothetical protein ANCDUO_15906 [Ancylostoma duodenale]
MFSKKRRLMMQWQEGQENQNRENGELFTFFYSFPCSLYFFIPFHSLWKVFFSSGEHKANVKSYSFRSRNDFNTEAVRARLSKFGPADGHLPVCDKGFHVLAPHPIRVRFQKGTFVVCKADLFRDDCALWRVDNQNMIQKYPPRIDPATKDISYKNSSTYSGWCDQVAFGYYRVAIKHIKQTRSEAIIQPEIPISDLFPAMTSECNDTNGFVKGDGSYRIYFQNITLVPL